MNRKLFFRLSAVLLCLWTVPTLLAPTPWVNAVSAQDAAAPDQADNDKAAKEKADKEKADKNPGQEDLDKATELQLSIDQLEDVERVIGLCESALTKGLDKDNTQFAQQLLVSSLWQHATQLSAAIFDAPRPHPRWQLIRRIVLGDIDKIVKYDEKFADAYLLGAKLQGLPEGDRDDSIKRVNQALKLFGDDKKKGSAALVLRARLQTKPDDQLADLAKAIELDAGNAEAWQTRAALRIVQGDWDKAVGDFEQLVKNDPENVAARQALAETLLNLQKYDLALEQIKKAIELAPEAAINYTMRARIHESQGKTDEALADLSEALKVDPADLVALISRAAMHLQNDDLKSARADVDRALQVNPGLSRAILMRSMISAEEGRISDAISDLQLLLRNDPNNANLLVQLASYYMVDSRPRKAISILDRLIEKEKGIWQAYRSRADALLSVGKHAEAVRDYEEALKLQPDSTNILNNLSWVLATSPDDNVRNGERSIELATKACELTDYKMPHILSTLGAGYAESGDFENAIKWSNKAVELGREQQNPQVEQLEEEVKSYKAGKPFREIQNVEEKAAPPRRVIET